MKLPPDLNKSVERFIHHFGSSTVIICRFEFDSQAHTAVAKDGIYTTFGDFMKSKSPILFQIKMKSKEAALVEAKERLFFS